MSKKLILPKKTMTTNQYPFHIENISKKYLRIKSLWKDNLPTGIFSLFRRRKISNQISLHIYHISRSYDSISIYISRRPFRNILYRHPSNLYCICRSYISVSIYIPNENIFCLKRNISCRNPDSGIAFRRVRNCVDISTPACKSISSSTGEVETIRRQGTLLPNRMLDYFSVYIDPANSGKTTIHTNALICICMSIGINRNDFLVYTL